MPPKLPGFYYDSEKKRYFPGNAPAEIEPDWLAAQPILVRTAQLIGARRSAFSCLSDVKTSPSNYTTRINLLRRIQDTEYSRTKSSHAIGVVSHGGCRLTAMAVSSENQTFLCGDSFGNVQTCRPVAGSFLDIPGAPPTQHYVWNQEIVLASEISSVQCVGKLYMATSFGPRPQVLIASFSEESESSHPSISSIIASPSVRDIWDSHFDGNSICLAMKDGIAHIESLDKPTIEVRRAGGDAMAITRYESCVYAGLRNGRVFRSDLRTPSQGEDLLPEVNSLPVTKVSLPRESELFVARMNGDLHLYDLRMTSYERGLSLIRKYEGNVNTHRHRIGINHDPAGEYLFAAEEDGHIRGWNMRTGLHLDAPSTAAHEASDGISLIGPHFGSPAIAMPITTSKSGGALMHVAFADNIKSFQLGMRHWATEGI